MYTGSVRLHLCLRLQKSCLFSMYACLHPYHRRMSTRNIYGSTTSSSNTARRQQPVHTITSGMNDDELVQAEYTACGKVIQAASGKMSSNSPSVINEMGWNNNPYSQARAGDCTKGEPEFNGVKEPIHCNIEPKGVANVRPSRLPHRKRRAWGQFLVHHLLAIH